MALKLTLSIRQTQRLAITQKMQQSVAILAMSNEQLAEFLRDEQDENPLLELIEPKISTSRPAAGHSVIDVISETQAAPETLISSLIRQLHAVKATPETRNAAGIIISHLNDQGLLDEPLVNLARDNQLGIGEITTALQLVQSFEPTGVGAQSFIEYIELQLRHDGIWSEDYENLLTHLSYKTTKHSKLASTLDLTETQIDQMMGVIRGLSLMPADAVDPPAIQHIIPDVLFQTSSRGETTVTLNQDAFPRLRSESAYLDGSLTQDAEITRYLETRLQRVNWLRHALEKRASTILRISVAIAEVQAAFFKAGPMKMLPLTMAEIAAKVEIHESTVSRAISGKYFMCDSGTHPISYFFSPALNTANGNTISTTAIRARILQIVNAEQAENVLSDTKIRDFLKQEGITVARRTIAKYREGMNVPTSSIRRIQKRKR